MRAREYISRKVQDPPFQGEICERYHPDMSGVKGTQYKEQETVVKEF